MLCIHIRGLKEPNLWGYDFFGGGSVEIANYSL